ncbi:unnamed protein product [Durusdinium trenchii]|uniref:Uncharacterized protein n=1 Tax=Durusdinium trenchii TaxID=1381693 RepID=A0ABP0RZS2_9DINO
MWSDANVSIHQKRCQIIFLMTLMTSFLGLYLPYRCTRQREWLVMPTTNLAWATLLSVLVNGSIMAIEYALDQAVYTLIGAVDHFVRLAVAMTGLAMGFSMQIFLVHYIHAQEGASLRRWRRVVWTKMAGVPNAQLVECNDLAAACPGDCAICLEPLVALPEHLALSPIHRKRVGLPNGPVEASLRAHVSRLVCGRMDDARGDLSAVPGAHWEPEAMSEDLPPTWRPRRRRRNAKHSGSSVHRDSGCSQS